MNQMKFNAINAADCLIEDFRGYLDGTVDLSVDNHECSLANAERLRDVLESVRELGEAIEEGDPQRMADLWIRLKPEVDREQESGFSLPGVWDEIEPGLFVREYNQGKAFLEAELGESLVCIQAKVMTSPGGIINALESVGEERVYRQNDIPGSIYRLEKKMEKAIAELINSNL
jgi:hypothetical protein